MTSNNEQSNPSTGSVAGDITTRVTVTLDSTLTDAERAAVASCIADDEAATAYERADTLRGLLERIR